MKSKGTGLPGSAAIILYHISSQPIINLPFPISNIQFLGLKDGAEWGAVLCTYNSFLIN